MRTGEGFVEVEGGRVWYEVVGSGGATPLLVLHGGPGFTHEYCRSLEGLADERPVVFYDQLGCGRSDRPDDVSLWTTERHVRELAQLRRDLGLDAVHILGQSWGTMLATEYMLTADPKGVVSLVLASPCISIPRWVADAEKFKAALPAAVLEAIDSHERDGFFGCPEYAAALLVYYKRHVCRLDPWPVELERAYAGYSAPVYETMWGPAEWTVTGNLKSFDRGDRLGEIKVPALFTCGRYDEATPETTGWYSSRLPGSELVVFEASSHLAHLEERDRYLQVAGSFLERVEASG
jgi:proline iminopeptidase